MSGCASCLPRKDTDTCKDGILPRIRKNSPCPSGKEAAVTHLSDSLPPRSGEVLVVSAGEDVGL